jgi:hypothetical protein
MSVPCRCSHVAMRPPKSGGEPVETLVGKKKCPLCQGSGHTDTCPRCDGAGIKNSAVCVKCSGHGKIGVAA